MALTFDSEAKGIIGCDGEALRISDQGFSIKDSDYEYIMHINKSTRKRDAVTTEQLAVQLTAAQLNTHKALLRIFYTQCQNTRVIENPTEAARWYLKQENLQARWLTSDILEVWSCAPIKADSIKIRKTEKCYKYLPIYLPIEGLNEVEVYLDTVHKIISSSAPEADCSVYNRHLMMSGIGRGKIINTQTA